MCSRRLEPLQAERRYSAAATCFLVLAIVGSPLLAFLAPEAVASRRILYYAYRVVLLGLAALLLLRFHRNLWDRRSSVWLQAFLVFWLLYAAQLSVAGIGGHETLSRPLVSYWASALGLCVIPALAIAACIDHVDARAALRWTTVGLLIVAVLATGWIVTAGFDFRARVRVNTLNPIYAGHMGVMVILLCLWEITLGKGWRPRAIMALAAASIFGGISFLQAASRGPTLALAVGLSLLMIAGIRHRRIGTPFISFGLIVIVLAWLVATGGGREQNSLLLRIAMTSQRLAGDGELRVKMWQDAWSLFLREPIAGATIENPMFGIYPHNMILEAFMTTGVFGGIAVSVIAALAFGRAVHLIMTRSVHGWLGLVAVQTILWAMLSFAIYTIQETWVAAMAVLALTNPRSRSVRRGPAPEPAFAGETRSTESDSAF